MYYEEGSVTISYRDELLGPMTFSMLESEWRETVREWRRYKTLPVEVIDELERQVNESKARWISRNILSDDSDDLE